MSNLNSHFAGPAELKQALIAALGRAVPPPLEQASSLVPGDVAAEQAPDSPSRPSAAVPLAHWDPALLHRVEVMLARHVGPIAAVLVRRSAPACHDVPTLCERLAEQVAGPGGDRIEGARPLSALDGPAPGLIPDSLIAASAKVLAGYLGPIAPVVARRAAARAPDRAAYFGTLEEAIADPEKRNAVRTLLDKLH